MLDRDAVASVRVRPESSGFGAEITGVDLARPLPPAELAQVRQAWIDHGVVAFPDQPLSLDALEAFTLQIGPFGDDPYVAPMPGHPNVLELRREPDEKAPNFGGGWHSDWSFQITPPSATILRSEVVPPVGGDTLFVVAQRAYDDLSETMKALLAPLRAIQSATRPYGAQG
ncbi:MAG: TauD/TfdA dioxygenase family protein, partial [Phenylobacterium sp.]